MKGILFKRKELDKSVKMVNKEKSAMQLTSEQIAIVNYDIHGHEILKVIAFAGTGKTTTLYEYTKARPNLRFLYVAFNKSVQLEADSKFPNNVNCRTAHSLAWQQFGSKYRHKLLPSLKANTVMETLNLSTYEDAKFVLDTLLRYLVSTDEQISNKHIPMLAWQYYEQKKVQLPDFANTAKELWLRMCDEGNNEIGMLHDGYLKLYQLSKPSLNFDCILLDEAQDTNPVTADFVLSQPCPKILVGDPHQQIYSFRGARDAMQEITAASTMYLTHSFRFGSKIAEIANQILHCFKYENRSLIGMRDEGAAGILYDNHAVIARTNATVFSEAVSFYKICKIGFVGGIQGYRFDEIVDTYYLYNKKTDKIKNSYIKSFKDYYDLKDFANTVEDWELSSRCTVVEEYRHQIPKLVRDIQNKAVDLEDAEIILTTAHKSKGIEFKEVRLADDFPKLVENGKPISRDSIDIDEFNLIYVSITRAQEKILLSDTLQEFTEQYSTYSNASEISLELLNLIPEEWQKNAVVEADRIFKIAGGDELRIYIEKINQAIKNGIEINSYSQHLRQCHDEKCHKQIIPKEVRAEKEIVIEEKTEIKMTRQTEQAILKQQHESLDRLQTENPEKYAQVAQQAADALGLNINNPGLGGRLKIKFKMFEVLGL